MNKKGFTLIELLAVIVILAIIAVIAVPIVINIIDDSKNLCGIVSRKDLLKATIGGADINKIPVGMIMTRTPNVITVNKDDDIILDIDHILWYVDKTNKRFYRTDNREMEYDESKIKGIVEYVYKPAYEYYYALWLANQKNEHKLKEQYVPQVQEIRIPIPQRKVKKRKLFSFLDEEE